ncbi:MAG: hypothetical protein PHQ95_04335 [Candidatus Gracilibacteria bacterium]|nr:hypothetical protein [Candidatus Gracilibacteria bacterium]
MFSEQHYTLEQVLDAVGLLKQEKGVDKILASIKEKIFGNDLNDENIEEFKVFVQDFTSMYYLMKKKFREKYRSTGERYFEHLRAVVNNVLELPNPNTQKILIAISHDCIEDTNIDFRTLNIIYGHEITLAVQAISKDSWEYYIATDNQHEDEKKKQAKDIRNKQYFGHLASFDTFKKHIKDLAWSKGFELSEEKIEEIARNALDVKFADRIHNLSTQWDPNNLEQVRKKVNETKKYFLNIARETNTEAYNKIQSFILILEVKINGTSKKVNTLLGNSVL